VTFSVNVGKAVNNTDWYQSVQMHHPTCVYFPNTHRVIQWPWRYERRAAIPFLRVLYFFDHKR